jgi:hypothetical protein
MTGGCFHPTGNLHPEGVTTLRHARHTQIVVTIVAVSSPPSTHHS